MNSAHAAEPERGRVTAFRYKRSRIGHWIGLIWATLGFAVTILIVWAIISDGPSLGEIGFGVFAVGWALVSLLVYFHVDKRRLEIGEGGITAFSGDGKLSATWDEVTKVERFNSKLDGKPRVHFQTSKGDFIVSHDLADIEQCLNTVRHHVGERFMETKPKGWLWRPSCSNCGTRFSGNSCTVCELPL